MLGQWVVLLEAEGDPANIPNHAGDLKKLHEALAPGPYGGALECPGRYALQVTATGASLVDALLDVVARWTHAVRDLGLPMWELVRTEVFTPDALEQEFESAHHWEIGAGRPELDRGAEEHDEIGRELLHRAFADPLTGLLGRQAFAHRLEDALTHNRASRPVAVVWLDLEGFQRVNKVLGESTGDELLTAVAQRLVAVVRPRDLHARLGGDEYGVLLQDSNEEAALAVTNRMLEAVRLPMTICGHDLTLAASAGVVVSQPGESAEVVLSHAGGPSGQPRRPAMIVPCSTGPTCPNRLLRRAQSSPASRCKTASPTSS